MKAVGIHLFMGAFSVGVEKHFKVACHLEAGSFGVETWKHNRHHVPVHIDASQNWDGLEVQHRAPDLVFGNPACSGFSPMTEQKFRGADSHLNAGIRAVVKTGARLGARMIAIESVRAMGTVGLPLLNELWAGVKKQYPAAFVINVNAVNHRVCQWRPRSFFLLSDSLAFRPSGVDTPGPALLDAIAGISASAPNQEPLEGLLKNNELKLFPLLKPGMRVDAIPMAQLEKLSPYYADRTKRWSMAPRAHWPRRLNPAKMCGTIYGNELKYVHPIEDRLLTIREVARVMGIPDEFEIVGPLGGKQMVQMSKGICSSVGEYLAREIAAFFKGERAGVVTPEIPIFDDEPYQLNTRPWPIQR